MKQKRSASFEIKAISNLIRRHANKSASKQYIDSVTGTNGWVIGFLAENEGKDIFQRDLEEQLSIRRSTVSSVLQLMEKKGFIMRMPVDYDARLKKLVLTDKAYKIHAIASNDIAELEHKLTKGLTAEELAAFFKVIDKIKSNIE
ncbi:MAG: MarR family transcriptional regulator [Desulfitobacteriaceae bacterium]|nr:MarR family transcriptional regulator [Desulfitobacteriaceae bacterium]MDD4346845.1 MarR family transcriptional regulator [Desulfitobacteriaceae bacterium]MDD4400595.1 MarR family transcriptional regulator [Desulfitobacteriaceae bacterium]